VEVTVITVVVIMSEFAEMKFMGNYLLEVLSHNEFFQHLS